MQGGRVFPAYSSWMNALARKKLAEKKAIMVASLVSRYYFDHRLCLALIYA